MHGKTSRSVVSLYHVTSSTLSLLQVVPGGRAGLIRIAAVLNNAYLGFFIPDYTAYNEMLTLFRNVSSLHLLMDVCACSHRIPSMRRLPRFFYLAFCVAVDCTVHRAFPAGFKVPKQEME